MIVQNEDIEILNLNTKYFNKDNYSLNSSFYKSDAESYTRILKIIKEKGIEIKRIKDISDHTYVPKRIKTIFTEKDVGIPYLSPKDTFTFPLTAEKFSLYFPDECIVEDKQLLITCSGTTGRSVISNKLFKNFCLSNDMIRISISINYLGYIFAFINTKMGQSLIKRNEYGSTVKHINSEHIELLEIPLFNEILDEVNNLIIKSHTIRERSQIEMNNVKKSFYDLIKLPIIYPKDIYTDFGNNFNENNCFALNSSNLECRFDCSYHNPVYTLNMENIIKKSQTDEFNIVNLEDLVDIYVPPRAKRNYVKEEDIGIPFLQGSHITQIKPQGIQKIYYKMKNIDRFIIKEGMILLTRSGTIGKLSLVSHYWDNWGASDHIIRIKIKNNCINPGYLLLFLLSDFGKIQFDHLVYGSNVDEIGEAGDLINTIKILVPTNKTVENDLGNKVINAYNNRDKANLIEDCAINKFEDKINTYYSNLSN